MVTHRNQVEMEPAVAAEDTDLLQIGATAIIHTVKTLVEDGVLLMPIVQIPARAAAQAHTGLQILVGAQVADMVPVALW